jgi:CheY-like chemotaxis protein
MLSLRDGRAASVLVVEDDEMLRTCSAEIVVEAGFNAVEAANADEALTILERRSDIALLLTDIQMPGSMDGLKLAATVERRWPDIKIILISGDEEAAERKRPANSRLFFKPFRTIQIVQELREMIQA